MAVWESVTFIMLIFTSFDIPMRVAFEAWYPPVVLSVCAIVQLVTDVIFIADMLVNSLTAFEGPGGQFETRPWPILCHYARTWMVLDLVGTFPFDWCVPGGFPLAHEAIDDETQEYEFTHLVRITRFQRAMRLLRLLRLMRIVKIMRMQHLVSRATPTSIREGMPSILMSALTVARYVLSFALLAHIIGCIEFFVAHVLWPGEWNADWLGATQTWLLPSQGVTPGSGGTWVYAPYLLPAHSNSLVDADVSVELRLIELTQLYSASLYHAVGQLIGMHAGIEPPRTAPEFVLSIIVMTAGAAIYAAFLSVVANNLERHFATRRAYRSMMNRVVQYAAHIRLEPNMTKKLILYYSACHPEERFVKEQEIYDEVPVTLRRELKAFRYQGAIQALKIDKSMWDLALCVADRLQSITMLFGDRLLVKGCKNELGLVIVVAGKLQFEDEGGIYKTVYIGLHDIPEVYGEGTMLGLTSCCSATIKVKSYMDGCRLTNEGFKSVTDEFPNFHKLLMPIYEVHRRQLEALSKCKSDEKRELNERHTSLYRAMSGKVRQKLDFVADRLSKQNADMQDQMKNLVCHSRRDSDSTRSTTVI